MVNRINIKTALIIVLIVAVIFLFVFSLGQYNATDIAKPQAFKDEREEAKKKHRWYKKVLRNQKKLKQDLDRKFKWIYRAVRIGLVSIWALSMLLLYSFGIILGMAGVIAYTGIIGGFIVGANYLTSGTYYDLKDFIESVKVRTENWVYGKYITLDKKIEATQVKIENLEESYPNISSP